MNTDDEAVKKENLVIIILKTFQSRPSDIKLCRFPSACVSGFLLKGSNSLLRFTNTSPRRSIHSSTIWLTSSGHSIILHNADLLTIPILSSQHIYQSNSQPSTCKNTWRDFRAKFPNPKWPPFAEHLLLLSIESCPVKGCHGFSSILMSNIS